MGSRMTELHKPEQRALKAHQGYREAIRLESEVCVGDDRVHQVEQRRYDRRHADCKPVAHNGLVGGSSPPGPTTLKFRTLIFQFFLAKLSNQTASLTVAVHYLDFSIAARASRAWSVDLV